MNKLNNKDKKLWDICANNTHTPARSKDEVWMRLEQQIDILDQTAFNNKPLVKPIAINWQPRFIYAFLLIDNGGDRHSTGYAWCLTACGGHQFPP